MPCGEYICFCDTLVWTLFSCGLPISEALAISHFVASKGHRLLEPGGTHFFNCSSHSQRLSTPEQVSAQLGLVNCK